MSGELTAEIARSRTKINGLDASVAQRKENIEKLQASIAVREQIVAEQRQVVAQSRASAADKFKPLLCKFFNQAFSSKEPTDELYSEYLSNREITVGKDSTGKTCVQVNDPTPFIRFSQDHSDITSCNLSAFTFVDASAQPLVDHLTSKDCPLKAVVFSSRMSQTLQQLFKQAAELNGALAIKFAGISSPKTASS
jgi:hypothetical protein